MVYVQNGQGGDRHVARLGIAFHLAKRLERLHGTGATDFADGVDRRLTHRGVGFATTGEPGQFSKLGAKPLPRSRQAKRCQLHRLVVAGEIVSDAFARRAGAQIPQTRCVIERAQCARLSICGQRIGNELGVELLQLGRRPGAADDLDPRAVLGDGFAF